MHLLSLAALMALSFQSAPGREAGRCQKASRESPGLQCFNPRPAVRPGDAALTFAYSVADFQVSIRARP